ncbi:diadenylate cyclase domain-containing protein, partial [Bacillus sp. HC-Mk]
MHEWGLSEELKIQTKQMIEIAEKELSIMRNAIDKEDECILCKMEDIHHMLTNEMHITEIPSLVFFHANSDEEGIKIAGNYSYDVYVQLLKELVKCEIEPEPLPPLEVLLEATQFISSKEVAF